MIDLKTRTHLDNALFALDEAIAQCASPRDWAGAEGLARDLAVRWSVFHQSCQEAITATAKIDSRCLVRLVAESDIWADREMSGSEVVQLRYRLAELGQYAAARALECGDRIRACAAGLRRAGSPEMHAAFQQWRLEQATE